MSSYNVVKGVPSSANTFLLQTLVRDYLGFRSRWFYIFGLRCGVQWFQSAWIYIYRRTGGFEEYISWDGYQLRYNILILYEPFFCQR